MTYADEVLADAPRLYWRLGESSGTAVVDDSGNGNDGTYHGAVELGQPGMVTGDGDTAVNFPEAITDLRAETNAAVHGTSTLPEFSMECIARLEGGSGPDSLVSINDPALVEPDGIQLAYQAEDPSVSFSFSGTGGFFGNVSAICPIGDHHVVGTFDGVTVRIYVDGEAVGATPFTNAGALFHVANSLGVPFVGTGGSLSNPHVIDEVAFYVTALDLTRIRAHAAAAGYYTFPDPPAVTSVTPNHGVAGDVVAFTFTPPDADLTYVKIGGLFAPAFSANSSGDGTAEVPSGLALGSHFLVVANAGGESPEVDPDNAFSIDEVVVPPVDPTACLTLITETFTADTVTPDGDGICYTVQSIDGWFDSPPVRSGSLELNPRGISVAVIRENARVINVVLVAHTLDRQTPLGAAFCFAAMRTIKTEFRAVHASMLMDVTPPGGSFNSLRVRRIGPIKQEILGNVVAVRFNIPMLAEDPRRTA